MDNNREPSVGGRVTVDNKSLRFGGSLLTGNLANDGSAAVPYKVGGADATYRGDWLRAYFEYAIRENDTFIGPEADAYGIVTEFEAQLLEKISLIVRYDTLEHRDVAFGNSTVERFTYGLNTSLPGSVSAGQQPFEAAKGMRSTEQAMRNRRAQDRPNAPTASRCR